MRVFLDANILFSASLRNSLLPIFLVNLKHHCELFTNAYAKEEARRNLETKMPESIARFEKLTSSLGMIPTQLFDLEVHLAPKDQPILCGAIMEKTDYLLTGDKNDFGLLFGKIVGGVKIVTLEMLISELLHQGVLKTSRRD